MNTSGVQPVKTPAGQRWALRAPEMSTVDRSVPAGATAGDLSRYCLMLGDDALVLAHRLSAWGVRVGLAEAGTLGGITIDLLGQARILLGRASELADPPRDADRLAYFREPAEYRNVRLVEIDCGPGQGGGFPSAVASLLIITRWRLSIFERLRHSRDAVLATLAARALPTLATHWDQVAERAIELGRTGLDAAWQLTTGLHRVAPLAGELFVPHPIEERLADAGCAADPSAVRSAVTEALDEVVEAAGLPRPELPAPGTCTRPSGRDGVHTETFEYVIADLQYLVRSGLSGYPGGR